jgi:flagellar motor switch protein FliN
MTEHVHGRIDPNLEANLKRVLEVKVEVGVELGRRKLSISDVLNLAPNSVLEFFKKADEPIDIRINGRLVARGEAVVMGERYGVRVTEVLDAAAAHLNAQDEEAR